MVLEHNVTLPKETVVMVWISSEHVAAVAQKGFRLVHAASDFFYLDCGGGGWVGDFASGNSWCDPFKTWQKANLVLGGTSSLPFETNVKRTRLVGQHLLWTEQSGPENLDPVVWPRAASSAELFWTGPAVDSNRQFYMTRKRLPLSLRETSAVCVCKVLPASRRAAGDYAAGCVLPHLAYLLIWMPWNTRKMTPPRKSAGHKSIDALKSVICESELWAVGFYSSETLLFVKVFCNESSNDRNFCM
ncbi:glycoside hydrolase family protein [Salix suchowensis]|nr:glycoside hydrolase family protein [Salix suchowensis]